MRFPLFLVLFSVLVFLFPFSSRALTLQEAEALAVRNYPKLKALLKEQTASGFLEKRVKREKWGTVNAVGGYVSYNRNYMLTPLSALPSPASPPHFDSRKGFYGVSFSIPLYLGGTIAERVKLARVKQELLSTLIRATEWDLKAEVDTVYLSYLALKARETALKAYRKSLERLKESAAFGVKVGKFARVDLLKVEYSLKETISSISRVEEEEKSLLVALETLIGKEPGRIEPVEVEFNPTSFSFRELYRKLLERNSLLKARRIAVERASVEKKIAQAKYRPKLSLEGSYLRNYGFDSGANRGIGSISLIFSVPVFTGGRRGLEISEKAVLVGKKKQELLVKERELKNKLSQILAEIRSLEAEIEAEKENLALAKEIERVEELKYKSGKGDMDHLLLAKSRRFLSEAKLKASYYRWFAAKRRLMALLEVDSEQ